MKIPDADSICELAEFWDTHDLTAVDDQLQEVSEPVFARKGPDFAVGSRVPTVLRSGAYRFYFYSSDRDEPLHVHASREANEAKFWLEPVRLAWSRGFSANELRRIEAIVSENVPQLTEAWNAFFAG